jgi:hypothetical protein
MLAAARAAAVAIEDTMSLMCFMGPLPWAYFGAELSWFIVVALCACWEGGARGSEKYASCLAILRFSKIMGLTTHLNLGTLGRVTHFRDLGGPS